MAEQQSASDLVLGKKTNKQERATQTQHFCQILQVGPAPILHSPMLRGSTREEKVLEHASSRGKCPFSLIATVTSWFHLLFHLCLTLEKLGTLSHCDIPMAQQPFHLHHLPTCQLLQNIFMTSQAGHSREADQELTLLLLAPAGTGLCRELPCSLLLSAAASSFSADTPGKRIQGAAVLATLASLAAHSSSANPPTWGSTLPSGHPKQLRALQAASKPGSAPTAQRRAWVSKNKPSTLHLLSVNYLGLLPYPANSSP